MLAGMRRPAGPSADTTPRQREVLDCIARSIRERGYPPTLRELGAELCIKSTNGVSDHLRALERKGYPRIDRVRARGLVLPREPWTRAA
jgi:repressor LexA